MKAMTRIPSPSKLTANRSAGQRPSASRCPMGRVRAAVAAVVAATALTLSVGAQPAHAVPTWCRAWNVTGETWYAGQTNGYTLRFTLRATGNGQFYGHVLADRGSGEGIGSRILKGGVNSDGDGRVVMNVVWDTAQTAQYVGSVVNVRQTQSGILTAGLRGTTVDTTPGGAGSSARWEADGLTGPFGGGDGRYHWPMRCEKSDVVRYPQPVAITPPPTTTAKPSSKPVNSSNPIKLVVRATTTSSSAVPAAAPTLGAIPATGRVTAIEDVDVYNGPSGTYNVVAVMPAGMSANVLARHPDGWCLLDRLGPAGQAWVAEDHLTPRRCGAS